MNNEMTIRAIMLANDKELNERKTENVLKKAVTLRDEYSSLEYRNCGKAKQVLVASKFFCTVLKGVVLESKEQKERARIISKLFGIKKENVTADPSTLIQSKGNVFAYADDYKYSATESNEQLKNLKLVWGDANLKALHDFDKVKSLNCVIGNVYTSTGTNEDALSNLKVVTGDLHIENLENTEFVNNLEYVGGKVYTKDEIKSLDEIKSQNNSYSKR